MEITYRKRLSVSFASKVPADATSLALSVDQGQTIPIASPRTSWITVRVKSSTTRDEVPARWWLLSVLSPDTDCDWRSDSATQYICTTDYRYLHLYWSGKTKKLPCCLSGSTNGEDGW
jgi:hypothetical protein